MLTASQGTLFWSTPQLVTKCYNYLQESWATSTLTHGWSCPRPSGQSRSAPSSSCPSNSDFGTKDWNLFILPAASRIPAVLSSQPATSSSSGPFSRDSSFIPEVSSLDQDLYGFDLKIKNWSNILL